MKRLLASTPCRALVAALVMASWLVLSNHCALGLMSSASLSAEHAGCCGQTSPKQDGTPAAPVRECCQSMQAVPPAVIPAIEPAPITGVPDVWSMTMDVALATIAHDVLICVLETGPPEARSFAELVLRHGVRSHAPPFVA